MVIADDSFNFGLHNSYNDWNIKVLHYDVIFPERRKDRQQIPFRNGDHSYNHYYYDDRIISVECEWFNKNFEIPQHEIREIAYKLQKKSKLTFFNEPDKHYLAEIYDSSELTNFTNESLKKFTLHFHCFPFGISNKMDNLKLKKYSNNIEYEGTAITPTLIRIKNNGKTTIKNIKMTIIKE